MNVGKAISQSMCPSGYTGRVFGGLMDLFNRRAHRFAADRLAVAEADRIVEIGFGTGQSIRYFAARARRGWIAGVDPSELMVSTARKRNTAAIRAGRVDLRSGNAKCLPWPDASFDKAAALHSFQFWDDPLVGLNEVARVLRPGGLLLLVLRAHDPRSHNEWLPNPISRSIDEVGATMRLLASRNFVSVGYEGDIGSSAVVTAIRR